MKDRTTARRRRGVATLGEAEARIHSCSLRNQRGFALLAALWLTVALAVVAAGALAVGRTGLAVSTNRLALIRGYWAAEGCHAILDARFAADQTIRQVDTIDLGAGVWCRATLEEPAARLNLATASPEQLRVVFGADSLVAAFLDWTDADTVTRPGGAEAASYRARRLLEPTNKPMADARELGLVRGFDAATMARVAPLVTTEGDGRIDLATAPPSVLAALPGLGPEALAAIVSHRNSNRPIASLEQLSALLSDPGRAQLSAQWSGLQAMMVTSPPLLASQFEGGVRGHAAVSRIDELLVPVGARLAVVRRIVP